MEEIFREMQTKHLVSTSGSWIERAVEQRHPKMILELANSILLVYDRLQKALVIRQQFN
jgi:hypothetical protein